MSSPERRHTAASQSKLSVETRDDEPRRIVGYGAVFYDENDAGTEYALWSDVYERVAPGAFDRAIEEDDTRSLFNHDANIVLGRRLSSPSTLGLSVDNVGLRYEVQPPDTQMVRDQVIAPIERGDISGSSFMFWPRKVTWIEEDRDGRSVEIRQLEDVELLEVGPVVFPAYEATSTGVRAADQRELQSVLEEYKAWQESRGNRRRVAEAESEFVRVQRALRKIR